MQESNKATRNQASSRRIFLFRYKIPDIIKINESNRQVYTMKSFGEQLIDARKAQNMTQEQLASAMNMTRQGISNWERNLAIPDEENIQKLSGILACEFELPEPAIDAAPEPKKAPQIKKPVVYIEKRKAFGMTILGFIAGMLVMFLCNSLVAPVFLSLGTGTPVGSKVNPNTIAYYTRNRVYDPDKACIEISVSENPAMVIEDPDFAGGVGWFYTFYYTETNGIDFYPETYSECFFAEDGSAYPDEYTKDDMVIWWTESKIPANGQKHLRGGIPLQDVIGLGVKLAGKDANGNPLEFYGYIELSHEMAK